jgi:hypothetical protein
MENNLCSKFIKNSLSENYCDNCGREEWYHPKENDYKMIFYNEGIKRASQHNFNQAEAGYNAKWFKRGALFGRIETLKENEELLNALYQLVSLKKWKEEFGKDEWYLEKQPLAWKNAEKVLMEFDI